MNKLLLVAGGLLLAIAAGAQTPAVPLVASALAVGETAPAFNGYYVAGRPVELRRLLKKAPWCFISTGGSGARTATCS